MRNVVWIVLDSARWDVVKAARTPALDRLGTIERRWSYASWTAPSHLAFLMGLMPHCGRAGISTSVQYQTEIARWAERLGVGNGVRFSSFVPAMSLPLFLRGLGYRCEARVSLPVLNPATVLAAHFDHFELLPAHNDLAAALAALHFDQQPIFHFINTGETHYPYLLPGESLGDLPKLHGVHGVWQSLDEFLVNPGSAASSTWMLQFDCASLRPLWEKQLRCVEYLDSVIELAYGAMPKDTWIIVTSDHGELFGEDGWFGHGPVLHQKVLEVFLVEGINPGPGSDA